MIRSKQRRCVDRWRVFARQRRVLFQEWRVKREYRLLGLGMAREERLAPLTIWERTVM